MRQERLPARTGNAIPQLLAAIDAAGGGGLVNDDLAETGAAGFEFFPEPGGHELDGRVFQALDLVEVGMIQLLEQRVHRAADAGVIVNPAEMGIDLTLDGDFDLEAVAVHLPAFVAGGDVGQRLGCFEGEILGQSGAHESRHFAAPVARGASAK